MKKRSDGRFKKSFCYNGKVYSVFAHTEKELPKKEFEKRRELESKREIRENPTLDQYHERWEEARRESVKEATLRKQYFQYKACSDIVIEGSGKRLGDRGSLLV